MAGLAIQPTVTMALHSEPVDRFDE